MEKLYGEKRIEIPEVLEIPKISDKRLKELYSKLKPIVTIEEVKYLLRKFTFKELSGISYIWNAEEDKRDVIDERNLDPVEEFVCLHRWGYYGLFKPSIKEVLSQAPERTIYKANTFEIVEYPQDANDLNMYHDVVNSGYHLSKVRSYRLHK